MKYNFYFPSLFKLRAPLYLIEDRAQEALRSPEEFGLVSNLRLEIMKELLLQDAPEPLESFEDLHGQSLTSLWLWERFQKWAEAKNLDASLFKRFFERQFQALTAGQEAPQTFILKEGRRPRVVTDIVKRGETVVSKKIDTSYKRFEICGNFASDEIQIKGEGMEKISPVFAYSGSQNLNEKNAASYIYFDIKVDNQSPLLELVVKEEKATFNLNDMMWSASKIA